MKILITGATGFVGSVLCQRLPSRGHFVRAATRQKGAIGLLTGEEGQVESIAVGEIGAQTDWLSALTGVECVIHCAAKAHVVRNSPHDSLPNYREVNVAGTRKLAESAADHGVRRMIYLSSIGVNGVTTNGRPAFSHRDDPNPVENYGVSKLEAELALREVSAKTGLEVVIVRPVLVYGPGVRGSFGRLLRLLELGLPLPFASVNNRRSFLGIENLVDFLILCASHPLAAHQVFLLSDGEDLSTPELLRRIASAMKRPLILFPFSPSLLHAAGALVRRESEVGRLIGSLQIDSSLARQLLNWTPPVTTEVGIQEMVKRL